MQQHHHSKTNSEVTSLAASSPARSPRRPIYYVHSPSHHPDADSSSFLSPIHRYTIDHSLESSNTASLKFPHHSTWRKLHVPSSHHTDDDHDEDEDNIQLDRGKNVKCYALLFFFAFLLLFSLFSVILWASSKSFPPQIHIESVVFESYNIHAGTDITGMPTEMLSINSTVRIKFRNPATFFGVHVSSTPLRLSYYGFILASGQMKGFYEPRKKGRITAIIVAGIEVPLYGAGLSLNSRADGGHPAVVPLELSFVIHAKAYVLGKLVQSNFYRHVRCSPVLREKRLGKSVPLSCRYHG